MEAGSRNTPEPTMLPSTMEVVVARPKLRRSAVVVPLAMYFPWKQSVAGAHPARGLPDATKKDIVPTGKFTLPRPKLRIALVRDVSAALERCELSFQERVSIDLELARRQHRLYMETLQALGCR